MKGNVAALAELSGRVKYFGGNAGEANNADTCMEDLALLACSGGYNPELRTLLDSTFAYVMTWQYDKGNPAGNRCQIAIGYQKAKIATRLLNNGQWTPWTLLATANLTSVASAGNTWSLAFVAEGMYVMIPVPMSGRLTGTPKAVGWESTMIYVGGSWQRLFTAEAQIQAIMVHDGLAYIQARTYDLGATGLAEHGIYLVRYLPTLTSI